MINIPKKFQHQKQQVGTNYGLANAGNYPVIGEFALKAVERGDLNSKQLESARVTARKAIKKFGKTGRIAFRTICDTIRSKKPLEVRMGSGKGPRDSFVAKVKPGSIIFEVVGTSREAAMAACKKAAYKLPVRAIFVERYGVLWSKAEETIHD